MPHSASATCGRRTPCPHARTRMQHDDAFALCIGVSAYRHVRPPPEVRDAQDGLDVPTSPDHGAYPPSHGQLLLEEAATRESILDALDRLATQTSASSTVFFYFSGHGGRSPETGDCYLIPVDGSWRDLDDLEKTAIGGRELSE